MAVTASASEAKIGRPKSSSAKNTGTSAETMPDLSSVLDVGLGRLVVAPGDEMGEDEQVAQHHERPGERDDQVDIADRHAHGGRELPHAQRVLRQAAAVVDEHRGEDQAEA